MKISEIMTRDIYTAKESEPVNRIAAEMAKKDIGFVPVTDKNGKLLGVITDRDIVLRCVADTSRGTPRDLSKVKAGEIMTGDTVCVSAENSPIEAARLMAKKQIRRLPVTENGKVIGVVSLGDLSRRETMFSETAAAFCDINANGNRI